MSAAIDAGRVAPPDEPDTPQPRYVPAPPHNAAGYVYFAIFSDRIKVGFSRSPGRRLHDMRTAVPESPEIAFWFPGTPSDERRFHRRFSHYRIGGEWFRRNKFTMAILRDILTSYFGPGKAKYV